MTSISVRLAALATILVLSACEDPVERAEEHYQNALAFIAQGDTTRASVEFRNVFDNNGQHRDARAAYAEMLAELGETQRAYSQYLRLVEQYPDDIEGLRALALLASDARNWNEVERHVGAGLALAPEDPGLLAANAALVYRTAIEDEDAEAEAEAIEVAAAALEADPSLSVARLVLIDARARDDDDAALADLLEEGLALDPSDRTMHQMRLVLLGRMGDEEALAAAFAETVAMFPDDLQMGGNYVRWLISTGRLDAAEEHLRARIEADPNIETRLVLVRFLGRYRDAEAQLAELDRMIETAEAESRPILRASRAALDFEQGRTDEALRAMTALLDELDGGDSSALPPERLARLHVSLAGMRDRIGDRVGARASVESALEIEPGFAEALKMRGRWLIQDDETTAAIAALRGALGTAPRDPEIMTLLALAHERDGDTALMGELLARAVEVSGSAPQETLRYASHLAEQGRLNPALGVLSDALALAPRSVPLLAATGRLYVRTEQWARLDEIVAQLRALDDQEADRQAASLVASSLGRQERLDELSRFLEGLEGIRGADATLVRTEIARGDMETARLRADEALEADPGNVPVLLLRAGLRLNEDDMAGARADLEAAVAAEPSNENARLALIRGIAMTGGTREETLAALRQAADDLPDRPRLQWLLASEFEKSGDPASALEIYRRLYDGGEDSIVIANNFASLLSRLSDDPADLDRAERVARRLQNSEIAAFRDTYGWALHRLGRSEEALPHLRFAVDTAPDDALMRFHLASTLAALGRSDEAAEAFEEAARLAEAAGNSDLGAQIAAARQ